MGAILDKITEFIKEILQGWVMDNLTTMFTDVNDKVGTIAGEVGRTPSSWNSGVFSMIENLSENVMIPIAGMIISAILCYELITMVMDKNNMHEVGSEFFFRYLIKACIAVLLLSYTFDITMAIFDVGNHIVTRAGGIVSGSTTIDVTDTLKTMFDSQIDTMGIGELIGLGIETMIVSLCMKIISLLITVMLFGRHSATGNGAVSATIISRDCVHWRFRDFSLWYAWQSMRCWYPALRLRTICTQHCGRWQLIPLFCVSACSRQVPLRNQSGMLIRTHFKERREQPGLAVSAPAVMLWQYP